LQVQPARGGPLAAFEGAGASEAYLGRVGLVDVDGADAVALSVADGADGVGEGEGSAGGEGEVAVYILGERDL